MEILLTPNGLRSPRVPYPWHMQAPNSEEGFFAWACEHAQEIKTEAVYLPIFWWNNSYHQTAAGKRERDYFAVPEAQEFVHRLDPNRVYFTVSNCDDGIYEDLPDNVVVFNAGGRGDIPIPLLSEPLQDLRRARPLLASFVGNLTCGGPVASGKPRHSSWDSYAGGRAIREAMKAVFENVPDCQIEHARGATNENVQQFRNVMQGSRFALCPRGYGLTSYRLYEAIDCGCVPVYLYDTPWLPYWDPLDWREFCVLCHASEIADLPERLRNIDPEPMRRRAAGLRKEFFTREGMYRQIARYVERL